MLKDCSIFAKMGSHGAGSSRDYSHDQSEDADTEIFVSPTHPLSSRRRRASEEERKKKNGKKTRLITVGEEYQAVLPEFIERSLVQQPGSGNDAETLLWSPRSQTDITDTQVESCLLFAIDNMTKAKQVLLETRGNIRRACLMLNPGPTPQLPIYHPMLDYTHSNYASWSENDIDRFFQSLRLHGKQFNKMSKHVKTKTVKECIQFYYMWKKKCPAQFRRIKKGHYIDHMRAMMFSTNITRDSTRRSVAAAAEEATDTVETAEMRDTDVSPGPGAQEATDTVETAEMRETDVSPGPDQCPPKPLHGSCPQQVATETVLQARRENVPHIATRSNRRTSIEESPTEHPSKPFICSFENCHMGFHSKYGLYSHMDKHKRRSKTSPPKPKPRTVNDHTATPSPAGDHSRVNDHTATPSPAGDHSREAVFACSQCAREFASIKSRNAHMKVHKRAQTPM